MLKRILSLLALGSLSIGLLSAQIAGLAGRMENDTYISATGEFKLPSPVLPELGGKISDTENVVTFNDSYSTHVSIACFPQDATQKWEQDTRGLRDYLLYFFTDFVFADFQKRFPGSEIESARFLPQLQNGSLIAYALLPGGSSLLPKSALGEPDPEEAFKAKRGTMLFVRNRHIYVLSIELSERVTQRQNYQLTKEKEDALLAERLTNLFERLVFLTRERP